MPTISRIGKAIRNPGAALALLWALSKGHYYKWSLPLRGVRFRAGRNFRVYGKLTVSGPGTVVFGDNVVVGMHVTPFTHSPNATITIGNRCFLNGVRMGCMERIAVGNDCILAEARIMDTNFHSTRADRWNPAAPIKTSAVQLEDNVWVAADAGLLPGTYIGRNSVVGFGAVCAGKFPADVIISGNPAAVVKAVEPAPIAEPDNG